MRTPKELSKSLSAEWLPNWLPNALLTVLDGTSLYYIYPGEDRPRLDPETYGPRTLMTNFGVFTNGFEHKAAWQSMIYTVRTMFFPNIIWATSISSLLISVQGAAGQTGSAVLIAAGYALSNAFGRMRC
jgi:hypothetical protein